MKKIQFISIFILSLSLLVFLYASCNAAKLEVDYIEIDGNAPHTTREALPDYVEYIFSFAIGLGGLIALLSLIYGGFRYASSAGSPTAIKDAKDQIFAGIIGLFLLLSSFLILNTINPQLTGISLIKLEGVGKGILLHPEGVICDTEVPNTDDKAKFSLRVKGSISNIENAFGPDDDGLPMSAGCICFLEDTADLFVYLYEDEAGWVNNSSPVLTFNNTTNVKSAGDCTDLTGFNIKSLRLVPHRSGVYLWAGEEYQGTSQLPKPYELKTDVVSLGDYNDHIQSVEIKNSKEIFSGQDSYEEGEWKWCGDLGSIFPFLSTLFSTTQTFCIADKYGVILYEADGFEDNLMVLTSETSETILKNVDDYLEDGGDGVSSAKFFHDYIGTDLSSYINPPEEKDVVVLCKNVDCDCDTEDNPARKDKLGKDCGIDFDMPAGLRSKEWLNFDESGNTLYYPNGEEVNDNVLGIRVSAGYIAVLCDNDEESGSEFGSNKSDKCEVFGLERGPNSDLNLKDNKVGDEERVSSMKIFRVNRTIH